MAEDRCRVRVENVIGISSAVASLPALQSCAAFDLSQRRVALVEFNKDSIYLFMAARGEHGTERERGVACCVLLLDFSFLVFNYFCAIFELSRGPLARPASASASVSLLGVNLFLIFIIYLRHAISLSLSLSLSVSSSASFA